MIIIIILAVMVVVCVCFLLRDRWEIEKDETYHLDHTKKSRIKRELRATFEWNQAPENSQEEKDIIEEYKDYYKEAYEEYQKDGKISTYHMRWAEVPVTVTVKKKLSLNSCWDWEDHILETAVGSIFLLGLVICGIVCLATNSTWAIKDKTISIEEQLNELEANRLNLISYYTSGAPKDIDISAAGLPYTIREHNNEVKELVVDIKQEQNAKTNPWVNWFVNPAVLKFDAAQISKDYIIDLSDLS